MRRIYDVIVVGGGAIGSSIAWQAAKKGLNVLLVERGRIGQEASSAAAGMLGAQLEADRPGPMLDLCVSSRSIFPEFAAELRKDSGIDIELTQNGILQLAFNDEEKSFLEKEAQWQEAAGLRCEWWSGEKVARREPSLAPCLGGLYLPDDGNLHAHRFMDALRIAVHHFASVLEQTEILRVEKTADCFRVYTHQDTSFEAERLVLAAGAFATSLLRSLELSIDIHPVKGQMMAIRPRDLQLQHTVFSQHAYLVPKRDGKIVVGATEEREARYDKSPSSDSLAWLLYSLKRIAPSLGHSEFIHTWTGLRPEGSGPPLIGPVPTIPGLFLSLGHFRNGILLSAITSEILAHLLTGRDVEENWKSFFPTDIRQGQLERRR